MSLDDLTEDDDNGSSSSSSKRYAKPSREDFEEFLNSTGLEWNHFDEAHTKEHVYETPDAFPNWTGLVLRVYSTIDERTDQARGKGEDAIRTVIWDKNISMPVGGRKKTLRIQTWRKNLRKKIRSVVEEGESFIVECPNCDDVMVLREGKYGEFLGCRNYPSCDHTEEVPDV